MQENVPVGAATLSSWATAVVAAVAAVGMVVVGVITKDATLIATSAAPAIGACGAVIQSSKGRMDQAMAQIAHAPGTLAKVEAVADQVAALSGDVGAIAEKVQVLLPIKVPPAPRPSRARGKAAS